jgi:hypothetical protein
MTQSAPTGVGRLAARLLVLSLAGLLAASLATACGKYGPPVRPKPPASDVAPGTTGETAATPGAQAEGEAEDEEVERPQGIEGP